MAYEWDRFAVGGAANRPDSFTGLDPNFATGLYKLVQDAHAAGHPLQITSAYRSPEVQARLWENALEKYGSPAKARKWVAPPGKSRHNSGRAIDIAVNGSLLRDANSPAAKWVHANMGNYGLQAPMSWEPWHLEPAGSRGGDHEHPITQASQQGTGAPTSDELAAAFSQNPAPQPGLLSPEPQQESDMRFSAMEGQGPQGLLGMLTGGEFRGAPEPQAAPQDNRAAGMDQLAMGLMSMSSFPTAGMQQQMKNISQRQGERRDDKKTAQKEAQEAQKRNAAAQWLADMGLGELANGVANGSISPAQALTLANDAQQGQGGPVKGVEINGQLVDPYTGERIGDFRDPQAGPEPTSSRQQYDELIQLGVDPQEAIERAFGGGGVTVNNNMGEEAGRYLYGSDAGLPAGWRLDTQTGQASRIPGGPAAVEQEQAATEAATQQERQQGQIDTSTDVITSAAQRAREAAQQRDMGAGGTSIVGGLMPWTDSAEVMRQVEVLQSHAKTGNLQAMREASPTGGALGAVSDSESAMLAAKAGALDPNSPNFVRDLDDYERTLLRTVHGREAGDRIFEQTRGGAQTPPPSGNQPAMDFTSDEPPTGLSDDDRDLWRYGTPEERAALWGSGQ